MEKVLTLIAPRGALAPEHQSKVAAALRDAGADLAAADKQGKTPLDVALEKGHEAAAALLREATSKH